jgi:hypothetical protein
LKSTKNNSVNGRLKSGIGKVDLLNFCKSWFKEKNQSQARSAGNFKSSFTIKVFTILVISTHDNIVVGAMVG